jgi:hypothetical protein
VDGFRPNIEFSGQRFYQCLCPSYLEVGWSYGFVVGYNADVNSLFAALGWCFVQHQLSPADTSPPAAGLRQTALVQLVRGALSLPIFGWQYLAVVADAAVADNKMASRFSILDSGFSPSIEHPPQGVLWRAFIIENASVRAPRYCVDGPAGPALIIPAFGGFGAAVVNLDVAPASRVLGGSREDRFFDGVETVIE